jgi:hypothetical protein
MECHRSVPKVSFVVRLWLEGRQPRWRFKIIHVQSGEEAYCLSLDDLLAFIELRAERSGARGLSSGDYSGEEEHR